MSEPIVLIARVIIGRPLCETCIAERTGVASLDLERYFERIRASLAVFREDNDRCRGCGDVGKVYSLELSGPR